jgi:hypothetical protein
MAQKGEVSWILVSLLSPFGPLKLAKASHAGGSKLAVPPLSFPASQRILWLDKQTGGREG